ncbi:MAG: phosphoribosylglycinamide formyltransferase [Saprospiraceae bacterium]|nr:phosphoribosylglycinamide formyltransferase [Saprospiraceae bacterium]
MKRIAILASGNGTNAENIIKYFSSSSEVEISLILSNKANAFVLERAKKLNIQSFSFTSQELKETSKVLDILLNNKIDLIVLAGFLLMIPKNLIKCFPGKIINIHPALLPKHGGKGMYGDKVHQAVIEAKDKESGITIHYVNEKYDEGQIIFQAKCNIEENENPESLAQKIHKLEYKFFPKVIEEIVSRV